MFAPFRNESVWDSWVSRWREWRGIDRWPVVHARIEYKEQIEAGEGTYYRITVSYSFEGRTFSKIFSATSGIAIDTPIDSEIEVRVNPRKPQNVVLEDTQESAIGLGALIIFIAFSAALLAFRYL